MKTYLVNAMLKYPGCFNSGYQYEIVANNHADAIKQARRPVSDDGHTRMDGPLIYKALRI